MAGGRRGTGMLRLKCLNCGLTVSYKASPGNWCPRCLVRDDQSVELITVSDQPSSPGGHTIGSLRIFTSVQGERHTISLSGELDIASAQILDAALAEACSGGAKEVVLDMGGIEFMDSEGLNTILRGKRRCEEHSCEYSLTPAKRPVQHVLEATGIRGRLLRKAG
jgi:anti-sigma B factor antagonist